MGQKILVVEDNELNLKLFCDLLRAHGYAAEPVRDGREALDRARAFAPDLVVMDIQMPYVSGLELIEQMKSDSELRATPIMAVTAYAAKGDEERIRDAGAEGYVSKPISVARFVEAVAGLLAAAGEAGEAEAPAEAPEAAAPEAAEASGEIAKGEEPEAAEASDEAAQTEEPEAPGDGGEAPETAQPDDADAPNVTDTPPTDRHPRESGDPEGGEGNVDPGSSPRMTNRP